MRFSHNKINIIHTINVIIDRKTGDNFKIHHNNHRIHQRTQNQTILHKLNQTCGINLFTNFVSSFSLFHLLEIAKTNHQTIAIQLENQATSQINAAKPKESSHFSVEKS